MFDDIEISSPKPFVLAAVGGIIAFFTASGGFQGNFSPPGGMFTKLLAGIIGAAVGFVWGMRSE